MPKYSYQVCVKEQCKIIFRDNPDILLGLTGHEWITHPLMLERVKLLRRLLAALPDTIDNKTLRREPARDNTLKAYICEAVFELRGIGKKALIQSSASTAQENDQKLSYSDLVAQLKLNEVDPSYTLIDSCRDEAFVRDQNLPREIEIKLIRALEFKLSACNGKESRPDVFKSRAELVREFPLEMTPSKIISAIKAKYGIDVGHNTVYTTRCRDRKKLGTTRGGLPETINNPA